MENKIRLPKRSSMKFTEADDQKWLNIIAEWEKTNESQKSFCARLGLSYYTFAYMRTKLFSPKKNENKKNIFIPVAVTKPSLSIHTKEFIIIENKNGIKLHVPLNLGENNLMLLLNLAGWQHA